MKGGRIIIIMIIIILCDTIIRYNIRTIQRWNYKWLLLCTSKHPTTTILSNIHSRSLIQLSLWCEYRISEDQLVIYPSIRPSGGVCVFVILINWSNSVINFSYISPYITIRYSGYRLPSSLPKPFTCVRTSSYSANCDKKNTCIYTQITNPGD